MPLLQVPQTERHHVVIASTVAGLASTLLGHPLDTIKTHLQTQQTRQQAAPSSSSSSSSSWKVATTLKWGLFRGIGPPLVNAIVMNTCMFSVFDYVNELLDGQPFAAGLVSGFAIALISTPTDHLKIHAQLYQQQQQSTSVVEGGITTSNKPKITSSSWEQLRYILRNQSRPIQFLYQGHVANLAREGVFTMVYLGLYHFLQKQQSATADTSSSSLLSIALMSSFTGSLAWVISYPFDTIKTLRQTGNTRQQIYQLYQSQGLQSFYKGCATSTGRAMLVTSSRMVAYQYCIDWLKSNKNSWPDQ